jgi:hypothetical protein
VLGGAVDHLARRPSSIGKRQEFLAQQGVGSVVELLLPLFAEGIPLLLTDAQRRREGSAQTGTDSFSLFSLTKL